MRVKGGKAPRRSKNRVLRETRGFWGKRGNCWKFALQLSRRSKQQAYIGRKLRKRDNRALWITRVNAAARSRGLSYSRLIDGLNKADVALDRKILADIAVHDAQAFDAICAAVKK